MSSRKFAVKEQPLSATAAKTAKTRSTGKKAAPRKQRVRLPADERRASIVAAARRVFIRMGLDGARIRDIAAEADVNVATLFYYFASKEEIFRTSMVATGSSTSSLKVSVVPISATSSQGAIAMPASATVAEDARVM
ncbi:MAG: helix-turn-helix transcriptional regulator [Rhodospirillales bacterium]|nr:helix-turn-helix transcriptional regulator [Rhodospirillales bacterium]